MKHKVRPKVEYDRMLGTIEWGVRPNAQYDRKACTIEWHTAHERIACSTIQWDGSYDPIAFLTRMFLHTYPLRVHLDPNPISPQATDTLDGGVQ